MGRVSTLSSRAVRFDGPLLNKRWQLGPKLDAGGQGETFLARDDDDRKVVVVKKFRLGGDNAFKRLDLFEREARVLSTLDHPGIPRFLDHFEGEPGTFYLVMQRALGTNLARALADGKHLSSDELRDILVQVVQILHHLQGRSPPVVHRDIKPANLVRSEDGTVMLVDFGGVRAALRGTGGSTMIGTFGYMAPEQLHGDASPATDVFGLGATMVALATGTEPEDIPRRGLRMDLREPLSHLPDGWLPVLEAMTDPDPDARPQSAEEVSVLIRKHLPARSHGKSPSKARKGRPSRNAITKRPRMELDDEGVMPLELDVPRPVDTLLRFVLWLVGGAGYLGLAVLGALIVPLAFTIASAFVSADSRAKLVGARADTDKFLRGGRRGFRRLQRAARARSKQLPNGKEPPK